MFLLGLLAALASTPLRLVEAASDQARTIAELDGHSTIEPIDGGVGDDSDASLRADPLNLVPSIAFDTPGFLTIGSSIALEPDRGMASSVDRPPRLRWSLRRRLAILQCFLI